LSQSVEQWTDEFDDPLGTVFPVVVRPRERLRDRKLQLGWQNCWDTLLSNWEKTFPDSLWWFERSQRRQIRGKLQEGVCIALRFVPDLHAPLQQNAVLYLLHNGVSVALWPRQDEGLTDFADGLQAFLQHKPLKDLPQIIRALRYQLWAEQKESAPCYHLTLLWDDPRRHIPLPVEDDEFLQPPD
jgi:hypothetical protein